MTFEVKKFGIKKIPFIIGPNADIEDACIIEPRANMINFMPNKSGHIVRIPGSEQLCDFSYPYGIDGLYWWDRQKYVVAICGGKTFIITDKAGNYTDVTGSTAADRFFTGNKPYLSDFGTALYGANTSRIIKISSSTSTLTAALTDADAPTNVSHVADIDQILLALPVDTERVERSSATLPETWEGSFDSAVSKPDLLKMIAVKNNIAMFGGSDSIEGWRNSGDTTIQFYRDDEYTSDVGIGAPNSHMFFNGGWYFIDNKKRLVTLSGKYANTVSPTLNKFIQNLDHPYDATGWETRLDDNDYYILNFRGDDKTVCVDPGSGQWFELARWDSVKSEYTRYSGNSFCYAKDWDMWLYGDRFTGKVCKLSKEIYTDCGRTLRSEITSPVMNFGTNRNKIGREINIICRKNNAVQNTTAAKMMFNWRINGATGFPGKREIDLGAYGKTNFTVRIQTSRYFKDIQYQIVASDNAPLPAIVEVTDDIMVL